MRDEYDFSKAKRASEVPHLVKLQEVPAGKTRITIMLDNDVLDAFRERAAVAGKGYQTAINEARTALQPAADSRTIEVLRRVALEEFNRMLPVAFERVQNALLEPFDLGAHAVPAKKSCSHAPERGQIAAKAPVRIHSAPTMRASAPAELHRVSPWPLLRWI